ncbi:acyl-CoA thioesterase [Stigmatella sp. ncwal1]|uniref:Acyl-CoA thioesterase n=1 Tax=Stigmatella ashevillensis TaxID=2995309 RepID=A0ABT5D5R9_9BACT|nr:acyl-CoA thioesterase [Stigmatella ashevillena]MDC0708478.1 acyl-CoA thioesterase [Stigmatella ashevillena]
MRFEESVLTLRVRPNDLDSLGHVNNATALEYLEAGRWAWMERNALRKVSQVVALTLRIEVDYRKEISPQEVVVHTRLEFPLEEELKDPEALHYRARFHQQILIDSGTRLAVEARVQAAFVHAESRALCSLQEFLAASRVSSS